MARKRPTVDVDDLIKRYQAGESINQLASALGISRHTVRSTIVEAGVFVNTRIGVKGREREVGQRYASGESIPRLAAAYNVSRDTIRRALDVAGVSVRSDSEAMLVRMAQLTPAERSRQSAPSHDAIRGKKRTIEDLSKRAAGKERTQAHATDEERAFGMYLENLGLTVRLQQAVGKYNLDLGVNDTVAVELFGGTWHRDGRHMARLPQRLKDLADGGFNTLMVWNARSYPLNIPAVAEDVVAYLEQTRRDPTFRRQYRMIWGDGQLSSAGCVDDDNLALVPTRVRTYQSARG